jgi:aryl-alcohol dehydrogenase-like predicted oxidoreductase
MEPDPTPRPGLLRTDLVLGTTYFGTRTDEATSFDLLDRLVAVGGRMLDTAARYAFWSSANGHDGESEALIGCWLAATRTLERLGIVAMDLDWALCSGQIRLERIPFGPAPAAVTLDA